MKTNQLKFSLLSLVLMIGTTTFSQAFKTGNTIISVGYGVPNLNKSIFKVFNNEQNFKVTGYGPIHAKVEYGVSDRIGFGLSVNHVGAGISYTDVSNNNNYNYNLKWSSTKINARMNIHFSKSEKLDAYWGFGLGYGFGQSKWTSTDPNADFGSQGLRNIFPFGFETTLGARYYLTPKLGLYAEVGPAKSLIQGGLCFKI